MNKTKIGATYTVILSLLIGAVVVLGYYAIQYRNSALSAVKEDEAVSSKEARDSLYQNNKALQQEATASSASQGSANVSATKNIVGNTNAEQIPDIAPNIPKPKSSIDSIRSFFAAVRQGDYKSANALIGPILAKEIAKISGTNDASTALSSCQSSTTCSLVLKSFDPPSTGYNIKEYQPINGTKGEQVSFKLSQTNSALASQIGDYNLDIFSEQYAGNNWVIQDFYINGSPISSFF